jgi:hypothetical protein
VSRVPPGGAAHALRPTCPSPQIDALLADLGSQLRRGGAVRESTSRSPSGVAEIDRLIGGGFRYGALSEISGPASSGRTSLTHALMARATRDGELVGLVDGADAFDPISAEQAGVDLDRILWVRTSAWREALRCSERLIKTEGFPLVLLDWAPETSAPLRKRESVPTAAWIRLARLAAGSRTALILLSTSRASGPHAELVLEMQPANARFSGSPSLLEELETRVVLVRHRTAPVDRTVIFSASSSASPANSRAARSPTPHESAA